MSITYDTPWILTALRWEYLVFREGMAPICYFRHSNGRIGAQALTEAG